MFLANMLGLLLKDEKGKTITIAFQTMIKHGHCKSNKLWEEKGREFQNRSIASFLQNVDIGIYSIHNERKSLVAKQFINCKTINYASETQIIE